VPAPLDLQGDFLEATSMSEDGRKSVNFVETVVE
jgi:hypothetical protein